MPNQNSDDHAQNVCAEAIFRKAYAERSKHTLLSFEARKNKLIPCSCAEKNQIDHEYREVNPPKNFPVVPKTFEASQIR